MQYQKLSASLLATLRDVGGAAGAARPLTAPARDRLRARGAFVSMAAPGPATPPTARVFIGCEPDADLSSLDELGIRVGPAEGTARPATVPLAALEALSERADVVSVTASTRARPLLDEAGAAAFLPEWRQRTGSSGRGVVVGVVDTGLDTAHPAFAGRVHSLWDQTDGPAPTAPGDRLGVVHTDDTAMAAVADVEGHGTHVAGIAAGADDLFVGVAPEATIVAVKTTFHTTDIAEGVRYVFDVAEALGLPAVVNLSLGSHDSSHDGRDRFSQALDDLSGPGRIVCAAAGNEGGLAIHGQLDLAAGSQAFGVEVGTPGPGGVRLNLWYPLDVTCEVSVVAPDGDRTAPQGPQDGHATTRHTLAGERVTITTPVPAADDPGHNVVIDVDGGFGTVGAGRWTLEVTVPDGAAGALHLWVIDGPPGPVPTVVVEGAAESHKVGAPAAAASAIAVAATCSKAEWQIATGETRSWGETLGAAATFSSPGPLRDGGHKPDVAAPGTMIVSARSSTVEGVDPDLDVAGPHLAMQGTSMACPFVTGLVALLLQVDPQLTPTTARTRLTGAAAIPGGVAGAWDPVWGHGLVDSRSL